MKNTWALWKKAKAKGGAGISVGVASKHGTMLTEKDEVKVERTLQ